MQLKYQTIRTLKADLNFIACSESKSRSNRNKLKTEGNHAEFSLYQKEAKKYSPRGSPYAFFAMLSTSLNIGSF